MRHCLLFCAPLLLALPLVALSGDAPQPETPKPVGSLGRTVSFTLKDVAAKDWSLADIKNKKAVHCSSSLEPNAHDHQRLHASPGRAAQDLC